MIPCDDNFIYENTANDNLRWGIRIDSSLCHNSTVGANVLLGNGMGAFSDLGTGTVVAPSTPNPDYDGDGTANGTDNCPTVPNPGQGDTDADGAGDHCDPGDSDLDGYRDNDEARFIGTSVSYACDVHWPSNLYNAPPSFNQLTIQDVSSFVAPDRHFHTSPGDDSYEARWDIVPGKGGLTEFINIQDVTALVGGITGYPPMFGGGPAFSRVCIY
jgi:parallel beta-helix repeat protein